MTTREEEMQKLKTRYAQTRGTVVTPEKKDIPKKIAAPKVGIKLPQFDLRPYLNIIEDDVRRLMGLKSREQIRKENTYDPLMEAWKRSRNMK